MRRSLLALLLLLSLFPLYAFAECTPDVFWTASWTDRGGQTTYSLQAPCKVYVTIPFQITATVTDNVYPNGTVGYGWGILDNGAVIAGGGFNWIDLVNGQWQRIVQQTYYGEPIDHLLQFKFVDLGGGGGAHWWGTSLIGAITLDPYPPSANKAPTADAGVDLFIPSRSLAATVLQGSAGDADGDALTYRWLEGSVEVQSSRAVGASGEAPLDLSLLPLLAVGDHTFTLEVGDGKTTTSDAMVLSVENSAPVAAPAAGGTFNVGEDIRLNGSVADYDGDTVSYRWLEGDTLLAAGEVATVRGGAPVPLPETVITGGLALGAHSITLQVGDGIHTVSAASTLSVIDTVAPTLAPVASTNILWPPNGGMTEVTIAANVRDNSGGPVLLSVQVKSDQPQLKDRAGKPVADWSVEKIDQTAGVVVLQLRNGRSGKGGDRTYSVVLTAADASENVSAAEVAIKAPHDKRRLDVNRGRSSLSNGKGTEAKAK